MNQRPEFMRYWGKAGEGGAHHPLAFHQLDVAACGLALLESNSIIRACLQTMSGLDSEALKRWVGFFIAIHDLGKFSSSFQQLRPDLSPSREREYFYTIRHDTLGHLAWRKLFGDDDALLDRLATWSDDEDPLELTDAWVQCVTGHHGQPPGTESAPLSDHFSLTDISAIRQWVTVAADLFMPEPAPKIALDLDELESRQANFSWYLAGLCTLADWLGSNQDQFPYCTDPIDPAEYFSHYAMPQAQKAIMNSGLLPADTADSFTPTSLFDFLVNPTPLQRACINLPINNGPGLYILEDVTGAGKTEAAVILLARLMSAKQAQGAYIALPTMATANAMYERTAGVYRKLYRHDSALPSLVLAHGGRRLDRNFQDSLIHRSRLPSEAQYSPDEFDAEARCNAWLADNNKKALLAQIGVGTIDQALLAVLQSRHQSLRLLGLIGKVLIVDEVHASDAYMFTLLRALLTMHARAGGSAILLSATLPQRMRAELVQAFDGLTDERAGAPEEIDYPLLTTARPGQSPDHHPVATRDSVRRNLTVELHHDEEQTLAWVVEQARQGHCVAWIRNTVNDAINVWQRLTEALGQVHVTLFHARFAMGDRLDIERDVLKAFGPKSNAETRSGRVVVATQVIEQSLDLDFDEMVSDLAPIDLLIQRAGRLKRHLRDSAGNGLEADGPDQRSAPCLHVLSPPPDDEVDERWILRLLPGTGAVYPDHAKLWLSARAIASVESIQIPEDLRGLIESVYGEAGADITPAALDFSKATAEGKALADRSIAHFNAIKTSTGYTCRDGQWADESYTPTRLGEETVTLRLARWQDGQLTPWHSGEPHAWALSELRLAARHFREPCIDRPELEQALKALREDWPKATRHIQVLPLRKMDGHWQGEAVNAAGRVQRYVYSATAGLCTVEQESR